MTSSSTVEERLRVEIAIGKADSDGCELVERPVQIASRFELFAAVLRAVVMRYDHNDRSVHCVSEHGVSFRLVNERALRLTRAV